MVKIVSITGTKGKTSTAQMLDAVLRSMNSEVLRVDTAGHYVNGERRSTLDDSKRVWGLLPTRVPGRYLWEYAKGGQLSQDGFAVLESSIGCAESGLGYKQHYVGVFLNVFDDHLGSRPRLQTRQDIAREKASIVFDNVAANGFVVFNADDPLVVEQYKIFQKKRPDVTGVLVSASEPLIEPQEHVAGGGVSLIRQGRDVVLYDRESKRQVICDLNMIAPTFQGAYKPAIYNVLFTTGAVYALHGGYIPEDYRAAVENFRFAETSGRMTRLYMQNGAELLVDYAHESVSLSALSELAHSLRKPNGKLIGVVRLGYRKEGESLVKKASEIIGKNFDEVIVYDKFDYDGVDKDNAIKLQQAKEASRVLIEVLKSHSVPVCYIAREQHAIAAVNDSIGPDDLGVIIVNDNPEQSLYWIKQCLGATPRKEEKVEYRER